MVERSDVEQAERLTRRRARMLPVVAAVFVMQQATYWERAGQDPLRTVDHFRVSAWIALSIVLVLILTTGGMWFRKASVRAMVNDESALAHRDNALKWGFVAAMVAGIALYVVSVFEPLGGRDAVHVMMSAGIASALFRFGLLERKSHQDG
jgi:heme/copper-type cytochrome/quinol oxidase subunit 2